MEKPLMVTDGHYIFAHHLGMHLGPWVACLTKDGQIADEKFNEKDPYGVKLNPRDCVGGCIHTVNNPMFPPTELLELQQIGE